MADSPSSSTLPSAPATTGTKCCSDKECNKEGKEKKEKKEKEKDNNNNGDEKKAKKDKSKDSSKK